MYTKIYNSMDGAGSTVKHDQKVWRSADGGVALGVKLEISCLKTADSPLWDLQQQHMNQLRAR